MAQPARRQTPVPIVYPERDGKPMAETDAHRQEIIDLIEALREHYRDAEDVYVSGDLLLYYQEGNPKARRAPDVFVVKGVADHQRRIYKLWEEKQAPALVIEVTSKSTRREDLVQKRDLYATIGVEEYFLHDPLDEYLAPSFQGFRLQRGAYRPIPHNPDGGYTSRSLGLCLRREGQHLRLFDAVSGELLLSPHQRGEAHRASEQAYCVAAGARILEAKARREAQEACTREAKARKVAEQARKAAEQARKAAEQARKAAEQARKAAEQERMLEARARREAEEAHKAAKQRAVKAEAELARLRALVPP